jgi:ribose-phosphate pyrophosphokinase
VKLFDISADRRLGQALSRRLGTRLAEHEERAFEGGEFKIRPLESVRDEPVLVCQSLCADADQSVNDKLMRLAVFTGALLDAAARDVTAIVPYLAYQRKDRRTKSRDPVTTRYVARMLEAVGLDALIAVDVHNLAAFDNAFGIRKENVEAAPLFVEHFAGLELGRAKLVVVSPDIGGVARARALAALLGERLKTEIEIAFVEKHRSAGVVSGDLFAGDVEGAVAIVVDDMICGGTTALRAARSCIANGAAAVHVAATHGVFGAGAAESLTATEIQSIVVTDTVPDAALRCPPLAPKLTVIGIGDLLADVVRRYAM